MSGGPGPEPTAEARRGGPGSRWSASRGNCGGKAMTQTPFTIRGRFAGGFHHCPGRSSVVPRVVNLTDRRHVSNKTAVCPLGLPSVSNTIRLCSCNSLWYVRLRARNILESTDSGVNALALTRGALRPARRRRAPGPLQDGCRPPWRPRGSRRKTRPRSLRLRISAGPRPQAAVRRDASGVASGLMATCEPCRSPRRRPDVHGPM